MSNENNGLLCSRSRSHWRFKISVNICAYNIFKIVDPYVTKRGIVIQHCDPEWHTNWLLLIRCHQGQGHSEAHSVSIIIFELWLLLQPVIVWWYIISNWGPVKRLDYRVWCQGHSEGSDLSWMFVNPVLSVPLICNQTRCTDGLLPVLYFLYRWSLCNQTRRADGLELSNYKTKRRQSGQVMLTWQ